MLVAVAERSPDVGSWVTWMRGRTQEKLPFPNATAVYYYGVVDGPAKKMYVYYVNSQGHSVSAGVWDLASMVKGDKPGQAASQDHVRFLDAVKYNAITRGLAVD